eukprot:1185990-Prorocentrum_minimum.AAC.2
MKQSRSARRRRPALPQKRDATIMRRGQGPRPPLLPNAARRFVLNVQISRATFQNTGSPTIENVYKRTMSP